jgi:hypothetical protein
MPESPLAAYAKRVVLCAPPLAPDQRLRLAAIVLGRMNGGTRRAL